MKIEKGKDYIDELITNSRNIALVCGPDGDETLGAGVSLALYIEEKFNKPVTVVYSGDNSDVSADITEIHQVTPGFETQTLKVILDYSGTDIETLNHYKQGDSKLILEIKPVQRNFNAEERVKFEFIGAKYDLIIVVGASRLDSLGKLYYDNKADFDSSDIINIDNSDENENYGKINVVVTEADSIPGLLLKKYADWNYTPSSGSARALLLALKE